MWGKQQLQEDDEDREDNVIHSWPSMRNKKYQIFTFSFSEREGQGEGDEGMEGEAASTIIMGKRVASSTCDAN